MRWLGSNPWNLPCIHVALKSPINGPFVLSVLASPVTAWRARSTEVFTSIYSPRGEEKRLSIVPGRRNGSTPSRRRRAKVRVGFFPKLSKTA